VAGQLLLIGDAVLVDALRHQVVTALSVVSLVKPGRIH
jgi:hypothetical protein